MRSFCVADFDARGDLQRQAEFTYEDLERLPGAADLIGHFSGELWREPSEFEGPIPFGSPDLNARWYAASPTSGISTLRWESNLLSITLLASGLNADADRLTFGAFQQHLLRELHDTGFEPSFALLDLKQRPLAASFNFRSPPSPGDQLVTALADRCFAASYFRFLGLA